MALNEISAPTAVNRVRDRVRGAGSACPPEWQEQESTSSRQISAQLILLGNALDESRGFELVHKGIVDGIFDPNIGDFWIDLGHQFVQALHTFKVGMRRPLIGINYRMIGLLRISRIG